jgi:hypothetical protein
MQNQTWVKKQDPKFIKSLTNVENLIQNLSGQVYYFIDLFDQYAAAISKSPIFQEGTSPLDAQNGEDFPTQTSSDPSAEEVVVP